MLVSYPVERKAFEKRKRQEDRLWVITLAGGDGTRMQEYIRKRFGLVKPKQYCAFMGSRSMLQHTLDRAAQVAERSRIVTVIATAHAESFEACVRPSSRGPVLAQPLNRGTAPGVMLPLTYILARDPEATVVIMPSDHFVYPEGVFLDHVENAARLAAQTPDRLILLGAIPDGPECEYGWIRPKRAGHEIASPHPIGSFREKPSHLEAERFLLEDWLWSTMVTVGTGQALWNLHARYVPDLCERFRPLLYKFRTDLLRPERESLAPFLREVYQDLAPVDLSKDVLEKSADQSAVVALSGVEWSDWGRPWRVADTIRRFAAREETAAARPVGQDREVAVYG